MFGDNLDNSIVISRNAAGQLLVNGGAVAVVSGTPTVANTRLIQVFGLGGNDAITLNQANGASPRASLSGGTSNDTLDGGAATTCSSASPATTRSSVASVGPTRSEVGGARPLAPYAAGSRGQAAS